MLLLLLLLLLLPLLLLPLLLLCCESLDLQSCGGCPLSSYAVIALRSLSTFGRMAHVCAVSRGSHDLLAQNGYTNDGGIAAGTIVTIRNSGGGEIHRRTSSASRLGTHTHIRTSRKTHTQPTGGRKTQNSKPQVVCSATAHCVLGV